MRESLSQSHGTGGGGKMREQRERTALFLAILLAVTSMAVYPLVVEAPIRDPWQVTTTDFSINITVQNMGNFPAQDVPLRLAIPLDDMVDQELVSYSFSETPERESNDSLGNNFVHFTIPQINATEEHLIQMNVTLRHWSVDYDIEPEMVGDYLGEEDIWLAESTYINVNDPIVQEVADEIAAESEWAADIGWNTYTWIIDNIYYQQIAGENDARTTLEIGEGGSAEFGNLFVALMRANNIPARRLSGWGSHFDEGEQLPINRFSHGWAEFYLPEVGWLTADPTWGITSRFDNFGNSDDNHIVMTRGAGVHYMWRGPYSAPFGETDLDTDYDLTVMRKVEENQDPVRTTLISILFIMPIIFALFVHSRIRGQRNEVSINLTRPPLPLKEGGLPSDAEQSRSGRPPRPPN